MARSKKEPRINSVHQLAELYNVVIGISISIAIYGVIDKDANFFPIHFDQVLNVITFLILVVPFYQGAVRHLFATYVEDDGSSKIKNGALLADFFLLFVEGCVFVMLATVIKSTVNFGWVLALLLFLDSIWGFLAWLAFTGAGSQFAEKKWAAINFATSLIFLVLLIFAAPVFVEHPILSQLGILAVVTLRTVLDYFLCWDFYFPKA